MLHPETLSAPTEETPAELLAWRPQHGVISLYARIDPADRSAAWRTELRNELADLADRAGEIEDHDARLALTATTERLREEFEGEPDPDEPRGLLGFVEVARKEGEERWYGVQVQAPRTEVLHGPTAAVHGLLEVLDDGAPLGIAAVSSERVRLFDWRLGKVEQLHDWELEYFGEEWRERKAQKPRDPARGEAVSAAGRDQHDQRMEANRERFAEQAGGLAREGRRKRGWRQTLLFGDERYVRRFSEGYREECRHIDHTDLINIPTGEIERRLEGLVPELNRDRELSLIERVKEAAYAEGRSALGVQETFQALQEGRVEHLVYDAGRDYTDAWPGWEDQGSADGLPLIERIVELALSTSAAITPVEGVSAEQLAEQGGVAALLRY
ncbi:MAG: VLRF1 family aeRF1-type release factor [Solirubrobacterales bacterium]